MKKFAALLATATILSTPALAADMTMYEEAPVAAPAAAYDWSGVYVGAHLGGGWGDYTLFSASGVGPSVDVDGFLGGVAIGYNFQAGNWVFGAEADISNGVDGVTPQGTAGPFWSCVTGNCNAEIEYFGTVRGRVGYAMDKLLVYGTGGFAWGKVNGGILNSAQQGGGTDTGWTAGAGVEYAWTQHITTKVEYLHVDLGDIGFGTGLGTEPFLGDGAFDVVRMGVNFKF